jgi:type I restriction enzyme S subunit
VLRLGDIVFGRKGAVDRSARISKDQDGWFLGSDGIRLRLPEGIDSRFMAYQLQSRPTRLWILQHATGTTMASLNQGVIERIPVVLPPLPEQRAIAHILGTIDDKIDLNRRMSETLEAMERALFRSWFVDFDPVRAKVEGRVPAGMDAETAKLFPDQFINSEIVPLPAGWRRDSVGSCATLKRGTTYKGMLVGKPGPALLGLGSIRPGGGFRSDGFKTYGGECPPEITLRPGDLYVSLKGATKDGKMIGSVARVPRSVPSGRLTQDTVKLEIEDAMLPRYLYRLLLTPEYRTYCANRATGSAVVALSREDFLSYPVILPDTKVLRRFDEMIRALDSLREQGATECDALEATREALLPRLLSGELSVAGAEGAAEATA